MPKAARRSSSTRRPMPTCWPRRRTSSRRAWSASTRSGRTAAAGPRRAPAGRDARRSVATTRAPAAPAASTSAAAALTDRLHGLRGMLAEGAHGRRERHPRLRERGGHDLPREAMRWALDHWDEAAPGLLGVLERFADGTDRREAAVSAAFFILHLAAEKRQTRAFAPLCRLLRDPEALEEVLGDGVTTTLKRILIGTYDGDLEALKGVIEAEEVDEYARAGALEVLAYLAATGRVAREEAEAYLLHLHDVLRPQHESFVWYGWTSAV